MVCTILPVAPTDCLNVKICDVPECPADNEVFFYEAHQPFYSALGERMTGFAKLRSNTERFHESFVILVPYGMPFRITTGNDALHVIGQDGLRNAEPLERMDHSNKQVLLFGIRKEFNIARSAMMAHHREACYTI